MSDDGARLRRVVEIGSFAVGLTAIVFAAGILVGANRLFPIPVLKKAMDAAEDWQHHWRHYLGLRSKYILPTQRSVGGVTIHDPELAWNGYTLITGFNDGRVHAFMLDMDGKVVHRWDATFSRIWPNPTHLDKVPPDRDAFIHGAKLFPNGDIILDIGGIGAAKLDRCSAVLWTIDTLPHHHVEVAHDGDVMFPNRHERKVVDPKLPMLKLNINGEWQDDTVLAVDSTGKFLWERSILSVLYESGWQSAMLSGPGISKVYEGTEPVHLNDIEVLTAELAPAFPMFEAGDVMLSLRAPNVILVVDGKTWKVKWLTTGPFVGQHDPDFMPNGHIMIYDNRLTGTSPKIGTSRLVELDPATREVVWSWDGSASDQTWYAEARGEQELLPNGNLLVVDPYNGRLFELSRSAGDKIVWEWINLVEPGGVGLIADVERVAPDAASWIGQPCPEVTAGA